MTHWISAAPALLGATALVIVPGLLVGWVLGSRGLALLATAPAASVVVIAVAASVSQPAGIRWGLTPVLSCTAVVTLLASGSRQRLKAPMSLSIPNPQAGRGWIVAAWAGSAALIGARLMSALGSPENFAQTHDNLFHLNAVRYVIDSGHASSLTLGAMGTSEGHRYYPAAWHGFIALVAQVSGGSIPVSINAGNIVVAAIVWPIGCMYLASRVIEHQRSAVLIGAILSTGFGAYPYMLFNFGVVYPWLTAVALLPAALGGLAALASTPEVRRERRAWLVLFLTIGGVAAAHPGVAVAGLGLAAPLLLTMVHRTESLSTARRGMVMAATMLLLAALWATIRPPRVPNWDGVGNPLAAFFSGLLLAPPLGGPVPWILGAGVLIGVFSVVRSDYPTWILWTWLVALTMHIVSQLNQFPTLKWWLAGVWYGDPFRPASLLVVAVLPLIGVGLDRIMRWMPYFWRHRGRRLGVISAGLLAFIAQQANPALSSELADVAEANRTTATSRLLTPEELRLIRQLPRHVPEGAMIAGNPMTGAALGYALADRPAVEPFAGLRRGEAGKVVMTRLDTMVNDPRVCAAVAELDVRFVLDFGREAIDDYRTPGLEELTPENGFQLVAAEGPARLYRVVGCRP